MNSPKVVVTLGLILILNVFFTGCAASNNNTTTVPSASPVIVTDLLPQGAVNAVYGYNGQGAILSATGGKTPYTWSIVTGSLPPGLSLNSTTGVISGTPPGSACMGTGGGSSNPCNYVFTVQVKDALSQAYQKQLSIYISGVVSITPMAPLPTGAANVAYAPIQFSATGGLTPYTWCVVESDGTTCDNGTGGALPPGLSMSTAGLLSGTPTTDGTPTVFTVRVSDSETSPGVPATGSANYSITIMSIVTSSLLPGYLNVPYSTKLTVAGGVQPYTWSIVSGTLPPGLSLDPTTCGGSSHPMCTISGTPTKIGSYPLTFEVTDGQKDPAVAMASLTINVYQSQLVISTTTLPSGIVGIAYNTTLKATGGTPPYTWSLTSGNLPPGLSLNDSTGVISGTPTTANTYGFTVQVEDTSTPPQMTSGTFAILINSAITNAALNGNYVFTFSGFKSGTPVMMAGTFVADGNGNVTSGVLDYNDGSGELPVSNPTPQTITPGPGSVYNITPNGVGTMTITTNLTVFQFAIVVKGDGTGRLIQSDPANPQQYGSGAILSNTLVTTWPLCGSHMALGFVGFDSTLITRDAGAGTFQFQPSTCVDVENGVMDTDDGGTVSSPTFTGAFNTVDFSTGRGVAGFTFTPGGAHFYASYLVSSSDHKTNQIVLVATEPHTQPAALTLWSLLQQAAPPIGWDNSNLTGTSVAELNALDTNGALDVTAGLFAGATGVSGHTCTSGQNNTPQYDAATFSFDENQGGTCVGGGNCSQAQSSMGTYCVDKTTGRVTLTAFSAGPFVVPPVFYLVKSNQAFVVGTDAGVTSGLLEQQTTGSAFNDNSVSGPYVGGTVMPITSAVTNAASYLFADGGGNINGTGNTSGPSGPATQNFTYTYTVDSTGRAVVQSNGSTIGILYVVSPQKFVIMPTADVNPALSVFNQ